MITVQPGSAKTIVKWAWLPKRIGNTLIWLEQYEQLFVYEEREVNAIIGNSMATFNVRSWTLVDQRMVKWQRTTGITG